MMNFTILLLAQCGLLLGQGFVRCPVRQVATTTVQPAPAERRGAGASEEEKERRKQAEEQRLIEAHRQNPKLPRESMPKSGRIADFDFDNWNLDDASGMGAKFVRGKWSQLGFRDGHLQIKRNEDEIGVSVPEFTYDHFTVAMSFKALSDRTLSETIFRLGLKRGIAGPGTSALVFGASMVGGALEFDGCRADDGRGSAVLEVGKGMVTNEWNWLVCSVDAVAQRIDVVVNGVTFSGRLLNGMSWNASTHSNEQTFRGWGIAGLLPDDWIRGIRFGYFKGCLDDVILYNRALTESEMLAIARRTPCGQENGTGGCSRPKLVTTSSRPGRWLLTSGPERSFRWNDFITDGTNTLAVRREGQNLELAPLIFCHVRGDVDLSKPIEDEKGMPYCLTATSQSYFDIFLEDCDQNDRVVRIKLPCSLEFCSRGVFSHLPALKEIVFCGDMPKLAESRVAESKFRQGHRPVVTAYADSKGWPIRGSFGGCPLKVVQRPQAERPYVPQRIPQTASEARRIQWIAGRLPFAEAMKLARAGDGRGYYALAVHCARGDETTRDPESAMRLLDRAIGAGDPNAVFVRGLIEESQLEGSDLSGRRRSGGGANDAMESKSPFERYVGARIEDFAAHSVRKGSLANQADYDRISVQYEKAAKLGCAAAKMRLSHLHELRAKEMERIQNKEVK